MGKDRERDTTEKFYLVLMIIWLIAAINVYLRWPDLNPEAKSRHSECHNAVQSGDIFKGGPCEQN